MRQQWRQHTWQFRPVEPLSQSTLGNVRVRREGNQPNRDLAKVKSRLHVFVGDKREDLGAYLFGARDQQTTLMTQEGWEACHAKGLPPLLADWLVFFVETCVFGYGIEKFYNFNRGSPLQLVPGQEQQVTLSFTHLPERQGWSLTTEGVAFALKDLNADGRVVARFDLKHWCFFPEEDAPCPLDNSEAYQRLSPDGWLTYHIKSAKWGRLETLTVACQVDRSQPKTIDQTLHLLCARVWGHPHAPSPRSWARRHAGMLVMTCCLGAGVVVAEVMHALPTSQVGLAQWMAGCLMLLLLGHVYDRWRTPRPHPSVEVVSWAPQSPVPFGPDATPLLFTQTPGPSTGLPSPRPRGSMRRRLSAASVGSMR